MTPSHLVSSTTNEQPRTILFRCDGTTQTGLGHTSRSLALAEVMTELGCHCLFVGHFDASVQERLQSAAMPWEVPQSSAWSDAEARELIAVAKRTRASGIVIDSYEVGANYVDTVEHDGAPVLLIDDFAALSRYGCSAVVNFTSRAHEFQYPEGHSRYFLGLQWFLCRRAIRTLRRQGPRSVHHVQNVLVTSGGSDPHDILLPVVESLLTCNDLLSIHVVISATYPSRQALEHLLGKFRGETTILTQLPDLSLELGWADLCISGAGLTKYESAYLGIPAGVLSQNEGQAKDTVQFESLGLTVDLGLASHIDQEKLTKQLGTLLSNHSLRDSIQQRCLAIFPQDPARELAAALLSDIFRPTA